MNYTSKHGIVIKIILLVERTTMPAKPLGDLFIVQQLGIQNGIAFELFHQCGVQPFHRLHPLALLASFEQLHAHCHSLPLFATLPMQHLAKGDLSSLETLVKRDLQMYLTRLAHYFYRGSEYFRHYELKVKRVCFQLTSFQSLLEFSAPMLWVAVRDADLIYPTSSHTLNFQLHHTPWQLAFLKSQNLSPLLDFFAVILNLAVQLIIGVLPSFNINTQFLDQAVVLSMSFVKFLIGKVSIVFIGIFGKLEYGTCMAEIEDIKKVCKVRIIGGVPAHRKHLLSRNQLSTLIFLFGWRWLFPLGKQLAAGSHYIMEASQQHHNIIKI